MTANAPSLETDPAMAAGPTAPVRIYPGWPIVGACFVMAFFAWGIGFYGHGFYIAALRARHGWPTGLLSAAVAAFWLVGIPAALVIGRLIDRHGSRWIVVLGAVAMGLGSMALGRLGETWQVFAVFLVMGSAYPALATAAISSSLVPWFERRLGLALGIALTGASAGGAVMPPTMVWLTQTHGFGYAMTVVGVAVMAGTIPIVLLIVRAPRQPSETAGERGDGQASGRPARRLAVAELLRSGQFWRIAVAASLALGGQVGFLMHQIPALEDRLGLTAAAFAVSISAGSAVIGRFVLGALTGRLPLPALAISCYLIQAAGLVIIALTNAPAMLYVASALTGVVVGCIVMLPPLLLSDAFGAGSYATAYGLINGVLFVGSGVGTGATGLLRDLSGGYTQPFLLLVGFHLLAALIFLAGMRTVPRS
ncbi:MAG: MFS transporter [Alphaproteobacteria bacterium]|jgi:predicted MFS family arabinose efflux permease|nr:MFS transporter [Alphaproteobacteria bacterium]